MTWRNISDEWINPWSRRVSENEKRYFLDPTTLAALAHNVYMYITTELGCNEHAVVGEFGDGTDACEERDELFSLMFYQPGVAAVNVPRRWYRETEIGVLCHVLALREKLRRDENFTGQEVAILCGMGNSTFNHWRKDGKISAIDKRKPGGDGHSYEAQDVRTFETFYRRHCEEKA